MSVAGVTTSASTYPFQYIFLFIYSASSSEVFAKAGERASIVSGELVVSVAAGWFCRLYFAWRQLLDAGRDIKSTVSRPFHDFGRHSDPFPCRQAGTVMNDAMGEDGGNN